MYKTLKNIGLFIVALGLGMTSCDEDYPKSYLEEYDTDINAIRILNAGADGTKILEGTIDEEQKMINFPKLDVESNFAALEFEADLSEGAALAQTVYDFTMPEGVADKTSIIRIVNNKRYKEYFVKIRKRVPVHGADFEKPTVYNFSGDNMYASCVGGGTTRCAAFDGKQVLVVDRGTGAHLLNLSDLKQNNIANKITINTEGVAGGTFPYNQGAIIDGHIYLSSLSGGFVSPLKIYHWTDPTQAPTLIANINVGSLSGIIGSRHGDNASYNIDKNGNGFIFFGANNGADFIRVPVRNYTEVDVKEVKVIPSLGDPTKMVANVYRVGDTDDYLWGALRVPVTLVNESMGEVYRSSIGGEAVAPKVVTFNDERYLMVCTAGFGGASKATIALEVYNITRGNTMEEALKLFDEGENHNPIYQFKLGGSGNGTAVAQTDFYVEKDAAGKDFKLYMFAHRSGSGFVVSEFPLKQEEE